MYLKLYNYMYCLTGKATQLTPSPYRATVWNTTRLNYIILRPILLFLLGFLHIFNNNLFQNPHPVFPQNPVMLFCLQFPQISSFFFNLKSTQSHNKHKEIARGNMSWLCLNPYVIILLPSWQPNLAGTLTHMRLHGPHNTEYLVVAVG